MGRVRRVPRSRAIRLFMVKGTSTKLVRLFRQYPDDACPAIHVPNGTQDVDARDKSGHDEIAELEAVDGTH